MSAYKSCFDNSIICLHFVNINKQNILHGIFWPYEVWVLRKLVDTFNSTEYTMLKYYFLKSLIFLCFTDVNKCHWFVYILEKKVKGCQYGYQMKGLGLGVKNMWYVYRFSCLFTFYKYKQTNVNNSQLAKSVTKPCVINSASWLFFYICFFYIHKM